MVRILLVVFVGCLLLCGGAFALAAGLAPGLSGPETTRTVAWSGSSLDLGYPVDATFHQGPEARVVLTGPKGLVDKMVVADGRIALAGPRTLFGRMCGFTYCPRVKVDITAPDVSRFKTHSGADLHIASLRRADVEINTSSGGDVDGTIDVDRLALTTSSGGDVELSGRAARLDFIGSSGGDTDLANLAIEDAVVNVSSGADVVLAPTKSAKVLVTSGGDVALKIRPATLAIQENSGGDVSVGG